MLADNVWNFDAPYKYAVVTLVMVLRQGGGVYLQIIRRVGHKNVSLLYCLCTYLVCVARCQACVRVGDRGPPCGARSTVYV